MAANKKSQKRQRNRQIKTPCTTEEFNAIAAKAEGAGLSRAAWSRTVMLGDAGPRAKRRVPIDRQALAKALGQCLKIGSNLNQLTKKFHTTGTPPTDLPIALAAILGLCDAIYAALRLSPKPETPHGHQGQKPK